MQYEFVTVDVFTDRRFGGNPLAVFPNAAGLTTEQMQAIANEFNLSETTFVLPPKDPAHTAQVRIFTPKFEMPFAGHPNVGTGFVVAGRLGVPGPLVFEEIAGFVPIEVLREGGTIVGARSPRRSLCRAARRWRSISSLRPARSCPAISRPGITRPATPAAARASCSPR